MDDRLMKVRTQISLLPLRLVTGAFYKFTVGTWFFYYLSDLLCTLVGCGTQRYIKRGPPRGTLFVGDFGEGRVDAEHL